MSTSFTYGGIDRRPVEWAEHDDVSLGAREAASSRYSPGATIARQRSPGSDFVHDGLDREPVEWVSAALNHTV